MNIYVKDMRSVKIEKFKFEFNEFLEFILDNPKIHNYICHRVKKKQHPRPAILS